MADLPLRYLFTACHRDGTVLQQTPEDVSTKLPGKSAWTDVDPDALAALVLAGDGRSYAVDLTDGHFEVDGRVLWVGDRTESLPPGARLRAVYFRRNRIHRVVGGPEGARTVGHDRRFYFGWEAVVDGQPCGQALMGVD